jgi:hypothetical protein
MARVIEDPISALVAIAEHCVCSTFTDLCECCGHSGVPLPPASDCCECEPSKSGRAYVQVERLYPTGSPFPAQARADTRCGAARMAVEFAVTVYRCVETIDQEGHPSCDETTTEMYRNIQDMATVRRALLCCMKDEAYEDSSFQIAILEQVPLNPEGGCGGTSTRAVMTADPNILKSDILLTL